MNMQEINFLKRNKFGFPFIALKVTRKTLDKQQNMSKSCFFKHLIFKGSPGVFLEVL